MTEPSCAYRKNSDRVRDLIREQICAGHYAPTNRLPSEVKLAEEFGVSRTTIRTVLANLESERIISREQGNGTIVNYRFANTAQNLNRTWEFTDIIAANGKTCTVRPVNLLYRLPSQDECMLLGIRQNQQVISIDRLFLADNQPVIHCNNIISANRMKEKAVIEDANLPLVEFVHRYCEDEVSYGITDIASVVPPWNVAAQMQVSVQMSLIKMTEHFFTRGNELLVLGQSHVDTSRLRLRISRSLE